MTIDPSTCRHPDVIEVRTILTGDLVAWLCPECGRQLPLNRIEWPVPALPPYVPDPRLTRRIRE